VLRKDWIIRVTIFQLLRVFRFFFILVLTFRFSVGLTADNDPIVLKFCFAVHLGRSREAVAASKRGDTFSQLAFHS